ncbi:histidine phosphatase family protein [Salinithrix halophila]|uniref:Histidine phosphatase family protein n=1 Tax=Salinithrix halophila TaxID=1485204 RepID=A0ABV8JHI1_9BACL
MTRFYLVRHGEPYWALTEERKLVGVQRDLVPLSEKGEREAELAARDPRFAEVELILTSPYTRAIQTAAIISRRRDLPITVEYDLHEWVPDRSLSYDSFEKLKELRDDFYRHQGSYPNGEERPWETMENVTQRAQSVIDRYRIHSKVIIVCHGMVIRALTGGNRDVDHCAVVEWDLP